MRGQLRITKQLSDGRFPGDSDDHRLTKFGEPTQPPNKLNIVLNALSKAVARIDGDSGSINAAADELISAEPEKLNDLGDDIFVVGIYLHCLRRSLHMH